MEFFRDMDPAVRQVFAEGGVVIAIVICVMAGMVTAIVTGSRGARRRRH